MRIMKKTTAFMLIGLMALGLAACGGDSKTGSSESTTGGANISVEDSTQPAMNATISQKLDKIGIVTEDSKALNSAMTDIPSLTDLLTAKYIVTIEETDGYKSFQNIYYGTDSKILRAVHVEEHIYKSIGVTENDMKAIDLNNTYPGITDLDFVKSHYTDEGDYYCFIAEYNELDDPDHLDQLYDCNCQIEAERGTGKVLDADGYKQLMLDQGGKEMTSESVHSKYED